MNIVLSSLGRHNNYCGYFYTIKNRYLKISKIYSFIRIFFAYNNSKYSTFSLEKNQKKKPRIHFFSIPQKHKQTNWGPRSHTWLILGTTIIFCALRTNRFSLSFKVESYLLRTCMPETVFEPVRLSPDKSHTVSMYSQ